MMVCYHGFYLFVTSFKKKKVAILEPLDMQTHLIFPWLGFTSHVTSSTVAVISYRNTSLWKQNQKGHWRSKCHKNKLQHSPETTKQWFNKNKCTKIVITIIVYNKKNCQYSSNPEARLVGHRIPFGQHDHCSSAPLFDGMGNVAHPKSQNTGDL